MQLRLLTFLKRRIFQEMFYWEISSSVWLQEVFSSHFQNKNHKKRIQFLWPLLLTKALIDAGFFIGSLDTVVNS